MLVSGIDEAGRGAIIGPMVLAGVTIDKRQENLLRKLGVKDSKQLSPRRRAELLEEIEKIAKHIVVVKVQACKIDANRLNGINLDETEAMKIAEIIQMLPPSKIYIDSLGQNPRKFELLIRRFLPKQKNFELIVQNYLDESIPVVSAASIVAKVERDREIEKIKEEVGYDFGVGYSHDERTREFLKLLIKKGDLPPWVRKTWITVEELKGEPLQTKLKDFLKKLKKL